MNRLFKQGEIETSTIKVGDIVEITIGVFMKVKEVKNSTIEFLAGTTKTNIHLIGEIIADGKRGIERV